MGGATETVLCILPAPEPKELLEQLKSKVPGLDIKYIEQKFGGAGFQAVDIPEDTFKDVTVLFTLTELPSSREKAPRLKYVQLFSAGVDRAIKNPLFLDTDIIFANTSGVHGPQISEWVIMTALNHNHHYNFFYENQKAHGWNRGKAFQVRDFVGQKLGILGYGAIGRQTARVAKAMGMDVIAYTATPKDTPEKRADHGYIVPGTGDPDGSIPSSWYSGTDKKSLHNFLSQKIDVLLVSVPLTDETRHFLSKEEFDILGAYPPLISNIARGPIIDQKALVEALDDGRVAAATLDVTDPEPLPSDDPLWSAPNVIITPHISGGSVNYTARSFDILTANLARLASGERLLNQISRKKGY